MYLRPFTADNTKQDAPGRASRAGPVWLATLAYLALVASQLAPVSHGQPPIATIVFALACCLAALATFFVLLGSTGRAIRHSLLDASRLKQASIGHASGSATTLVSIPVRSRG